RVDDDRRLLDAVAEECHVARDWDVDDRQPIVADDPIPVPARVAGRRPSVGGGQGDHHAGSHGGEPASRDQAVAAVVPGPAQDDDRAATPPAGLDREGMRGRGPRRPGLDRIPALGTVSAVSWVRRWLLGAPGRNDLERRQAVLLQTILVALLALVAVTSIVTAIMPGLGSAPDAIRGFLIVEP